MTGTDDLMIAAKAAGVATCSQPERQEPAHCGWKLPAGLAVAWLAVCAPVEGMTVIAALLYAPLVALAVVIGCAMWRWARG